jgi:hypothetical protein
VKVSLASKHFQRQRLILLASDRDYIDRCYVLAGQAVDQGNHPFGALLVLWCNLLGWSDKARVRGERRRSRSNRR